MNKVYWNKRYVTGDLPWDTGKSDFNLREVVVKRRLHPCKALEIGCGTGNNAIWLSRQGFSVTGIDIAEEAIERAVKKAAKAGVRCKFLVANIMNRKISGGPFGFVFDRGCFHCFDRAVERRRYAKLVHDHLAKDGLWLSLIASKDEPPRHPGPPQRSAGNIVKAVEPYFRILSLYSSVLDSRAAKPPKAWVCLMRKRSKKRS